MSFSVSTVHPHAFRNIAFDAPVLADVSATSPVEDHPVFMQSSPAEYEQLDKAIADINAQDLNGIEGFDHALRAFSGLNSKSIDMLGTSPERQRSMQKFYAGIQAHQDWYESLTAEPIGIASFFSSNIHFSDEQLAQMRNVFRQDDGLITNGELLLAFPKRIERNEAVTAQYFDLSQKMGDIVGKNNANWANFAVWASDNVGRALAGDAAALLDETGLGNSRYWMSKGNSKLISDIGPSFRYFVDVFGEGKNRNLTFDQFWSRLESDLGGKGISYLEGNADPENVDKSQADFKGDMKNAFKAYYDVMQLEDKKKAGSGSPEEDSRCAPLMLYANTLVGLQEQKLVQQDIDNGIEVLGATNPYGIAASSIDLDLPMEDGKGDKCLDTDINLPNTPYRVTDLNTEFTTADHRQIHIGDALKNRLNALDGNPDNENEMDPAHSGTEYWEQYDQRMSYIFHFFADYQKYPKIFENVRNVFPSRVNEQTKRDDQQQGTLLDVLGSLLWS